MEQDLFILGLSVRLLSSFSDLHKFARGIVGTEVAAMLTAKEQAECLRAEHAALMASREAAREELRILNSQSSESARRQAADRIYSFSQQLLRHFAEEERGGFFEMIADCDPARLTQVQDLVQQHSEIRTQVLLICSRLEEGLSDPEERTLLRQELDDLIRDLAAHEREENALLLDAYWTDEPGGD